MHVVYEYAAQGEQPALKLSWYQGADKPEPWTQGEIPKWDSGVLFVGSKGMLLSDYERHLLLPEDQFKNFKRPARFIPPSPGHHAQWIEACLEFSESAAEQTLNLAFSLFPVESVCIHVLQRGMSEIGERWYENRASVQQEHFASGLAMRRLDALLSAAPAPTRRETVVVGCPSDEWHALTPLLLSLLLRRRGLNVIYLGADVPSEQFSNTVQDLKANLVHHLGNNRIHFPRHNGRSRLHRRQVNLL